jgi:DNA-binding SARP family transcriptional activator
VVFVWIDIGADHAGERLRLGHSAVTGWQRRVAGGLRLLYLGFKARVPTGIEFRILGPLEALDEGRAIALGGSRQRALLALLLLHANETLTTDRLIDELWGERAPANAAKTVQMQISRLRKAMAGKAGSGSAGVVVTRERGYELGLDPDRLDSHRFERLVAEGRSELTSGHPERAVSALEEALSLWRGAPLADLAYEPFAQREIARLDDLRAAALEQLIEAKLALGGHAEVVGQLEALIGEYPYRERLWAHLMLALYRCDRQADALQAYQDARRTLVEELGIEPGERLRELERAILAQDPELHLAAAQEPAAAEPVAEAPRSVFVGRQPELAELLGGLDDVFAGHGRLFLLGGEPGIGKSRLAEELIAHARGRGARVLVGRCWEAGGAPAYWPWVQSLRSYLRQAEPEALPAQLGAGAAELAQVVPELRQYLPGLPAPSSPESEGARFRLFDATAQFLRNASQSRPILLVLDDLHAADAPSLLLLRFLARDLGSTRLFLLGAYRDVDPIPGQPLTEMLAEVAREPVTRRLHLGGLSQREVARYVELEASEIASSELVAGLHEETEGNPFFLSEIVRLLALEGLSTDPTAEVRVGIPQSVRDVISRRLNYLSEECNRVLVLASVIGREFALDALARMGDLSEEQLLDVLDEAIAAGIVSEVPGGRAQLRFAHVLIRDTLYGGLRSARRTRLHSVALAALEALYGAEPGLHLAELGHHALAGREFDKGLHYAWRAGERAVTLLAYEEGARLYETALDALHHADPSNDKVRCRLLLSLGEAGARAGNTPVAQRVYLEAADIARALGLPRELARAAAGYGGRFLWNRAGGDATLVPLLEEGLAALPDDDVELRVRLLARLAGALRGAPTRDRCDKLSSEAVELARRTGSPAALAHALDARACAVLTPDTVPECLALGSELRDVAKGTGDKERIADGHFIRLMAELVVGDISAAEIDLTAASRIADELRQPTQLWEVCAARALLALAAGRLDDAEDLIDQALELGGRAQPEEAIPAHSIQRYTLYDFRGGLAEVEPAICDLARRDPARPVFRCVLAHLHARLGRTGEARRALEELARYRCSALPFDQEWLYGMSLLAETSALLRDTDSAPVLYSLLLPWATYNAADYVEGIRGSMSRYLGLLATTVARWGGAARHFEDALEMNARMGARPWLARTQNDYARTLLARAAPGDRQKAQPLLSHALSTYRELGMQVPAASTSALTLDVGPLAP